MMAYLEARALDTRSVYDRAWEVCAGTEGLTYAECKECVSEWKRNDRADYGADVTQYRYIDEAGASRVL